MLAVIIKNISLQYPFFPNHYQATLGYFRQTLFLIRIKAHYQLLIIATFSDVSAVMTQ